MDFRRVDDGEKKKKRRREKKELIVYLYYFGFVSQEQTSASMAVSPMGLGYQHEIT